MTDPDVDGPAIALVREGRHVEAEALARQLLRTQPDDANLLAALCLSLTAQSEFGLSLEVALRALKQDALAFHLRHAVLRDLVICCGQLGLVDMGRAIVQSHAPNYATSHAPDHAWPGIFLWMLGLNHEALASLEAALERFPGDGFLLHQLGVAQLSLGDRSGMPNFAHYTSREFWQRFYSNANRDLARMWQGEPVEGRTIVVCGHGGIGDYIQFIRYARVLREMGAREVLAELPTQRIRGLLQSRGDVRAAEASDLASADYWVPTYGLCGNLFPQHGPLPVASYLSAPPSQLADAQLKLIRTRAAGRRCIAIAWHSDMADGAARSVPLGTLLPLFGLPNVHWVVTQRGVALQQLVRSGLHLQCSVIGESSSFDDTAALMAGLDGVVTIESYSLHMAGALGVPTWFLAGRALDWRHLNEETRSVWYPSVRLVRQPAMGDWRSAVRDLCQQLQAL